MKEPYKYKTLVADSQFLVAEALEKTVRESEEYIFAGRVSASLELERVLREVHVDILITDFNLAGSSGYHQLGVLLGKYPELRVLFLTNGITRTGLAELSGIGIINIVYKTVKKKELFTAINATANREKYYSPGIYDILMNADENRNGSGDKAMLTTAEREIVRLIASGLTTKEIAVKRNVSFHTVMAQRKNIFFKLGVKSISELVVYAMKAGITDNIEYYI